MRVAEVAIKSVEQITRRMVEVFMNRVKHNQCEWNVNAMRRWLSDIRSARPHDIPELALDAQQKDELIYLG